MANTKTFTTTQVGSWPRSREMLKALRGFQKKTLSRRDFDNIADDEIRRTVHLQEKAGLDIIVDGEHRRESFYAFITDKVDGTRLMSLADMLDYVEDKAEFEEMLRTMDMPASAVKNPTCIGKLSRREPLAVGDLKFLRTLSKKPVKITLPGPYLLTRSMWVGALTGRDVPDELSASLRGAIDTIRYGCSDCGACKTLCAFHQEYGTPKEIIGKYDFSKPEHQAVAFECSLCNLCGAICPENLEPGDLFYAIRREAMDTGNVNLSRYRAILGYEKRGGSPLFSLYALPEGCDTVFFPGCTLPGTRPETTWQIFKHLQNGFPTLGIVLDCCTKPSHDLGRRNHFEYMFGKLRQYLLDNNIRMVLVACPNCYKIFKDYGNGLEVQTVYEVFSTGDLPAGATGSGEIVVHDPCPLREETAVQDSVRSILTRMGLSLSEMKHHGKLTVCCGEGGSVGFVRPVLAKKWGQIRRDDANGRKIVTYCADCAGFLNQVTPTVHIADVLFSTDKAINGGLRIAKSPFTYINRLKLKKRFKEALEPVIHNRN